MIKREERRSRLSKDSLRQLAAHLRKGLVLPIGVSGYTEDKALVNLIEWWSGYECVI